MTFISSRLNPSSASATAWTARFHEMLPPPKHLALPVISRLKVMLGLKRS